LLFNKSSIFSKTSLKENLEELRDENIIGKLERTIIAFVLTAKSIVYFK